MTDARLRAEWLGRMLYDGLSDTAWRVFTGALMWSAENGTDGLIPQRYTRYLHPDGDQPAAFEEITAAEIWVPTDHGFQLLGWDGELGQSTAAQVQAYKENARARQRRHREQQRKRLASKTTGNDARPLTQAQDTGDVTRDITRNVGIGEGVGVGDGNYEEASEPAEFEMHESTGELSWPTRQPPDPGYCSHGVTVGSRCGRCGGNATREAA